jgi:hypothetical protein
MTIQNTCGEEKLDFFLRKCRVITTMNCIHSTINTINCSNSAIIYFKDVKCIFKTMGGFVSLTMSKKDEIGKKRLYSRLRSFSTSPVWIFWAKQCSKSSTTIIPYKHHHVHRPTAIHQAYKTNMKSAIEMKKIIRSTKDNKAFFILQSP